ncbi:MAG: hypothetical protein MUO26_03115 [Methanotrichaceae archaeon]|nr:hypothetical protein [Methanotrichaceae archaeon]
MKTRSARLVKSSRKDSMPGEYSRTVASWEACFKALEMYSVISWASSIQERVVFNDDEAVVGLFEDSHELEGSESTSDFQFHEPPMQPAEDA